MATEVETWSTAQQHEGELSLLITQCLLIVSMMISCKGVEGHIVMGLCEYGCVLQSIVQERDGLRYIHAPCALKPPVALCVVSCKSGPCRLLPPLGYYFMLLYLCVQYFDSLLKWCIPIRQD
jgi:hypothetical protein